MDVKLVRTCGFVFAVSVIALSVAFPAQLPAFVLYSKRLESIFPGRYNMAVAKLIQEDVA